MSSKSEIAIKIAEAKELHAPTAEDVIFVPVKSQRELKASFWEKWEENPVVNAEDVTPAMVAQETGDPRIHRWWNLPMFKSWFLKQDLITTKIIANAEKAHELVQELLDDPKLTPSQKLMAVKMAQDSYARLMEKKKN